MARPSFDRILPLYPAPKIDEKPELIEPTLKETKSVKKLNKLPIKGSKSEAIVSSANNTRKSSSVPPATRKSSFNVRENKAAVMRRSMAEALTKEQPVHTHISKPKTSVSSNRKITPREKEKIPEGTLLKNTEANTPVKLIKKESLILAKERLVRKPSIRDSQVSSSLTEEAEKENESEKKSNSQKKPSLRDSTTSNSAKVQSVVNAKKESSQEKRTSLLRKPFTRETPPFRTSVSSTTKAMQDKRQSILDQKIGLYKKLSRDVTAPVGTKRKSHVDESENLLRKKLKVEHRLSDGDKEEPKANRSAHSPRSSLKKGLKSSKSPDEVPQNEEQYTAGTSADDSSSEDRIIKLKEIVHQAALDRRIFCIFEGHRYIAQPIREELLRRGWLECIIDRTAIPRRKVPSSLDPSQIPKPVDQTQIRIDHTADALLGKDPTDASYFRITEPNPDNSDYYSNLKICTFGLTHENSMQRENVKPQRRVTNKSALFEPDDTQTISELIQAENIPINFFWLSGKPNVQLQYVTYTPEFANKFQKTIFCSKYGLWSSLSSNFELPNGINHPLQYPRMYNPAEPLSREAFFLDFYLTSCTSILLWLIRAVRETNVADLISVDGKVPLRAFEFAIKKCETYIKYKQVGDRLIFEEFQGSDAQWSHFRYWADLVTIKNASLKLVPLSHFNYVKAKSADVLRRLKPYRPYLETDGVLNLWIVKPYSSACGRGIFLTYSLAYIQQLPSRYIVQKYIERPFLIEGTKFDIRQWFMVTSLRPLEIWMYKECYLRFCTQPFNLRNLHESVHLSNNAVQRKYAKVARLHAQNMWDSATFQDYLGLQGYRSIWDERIYPGMRDAIITTLLSCQQTFDSQRNGWFEVYGADFMLTEKITEGPWLIEINESPAMDPSTPVTARLCKQMLRDVLKVVIDRKLNRKADTGGWEKIYQQSLEAATSSYYSNSVK